MDRRSASDRGAAGLDSRRPRDDHPEFRPLRVRRAGIGSDTRQLRSAAPPAQAPVLGSGR